MFTFQIEDRLKKKLEKLSKKDKILVKNFKKKIIEIISQNEKTIDTYKNLKSPLNNFKRIHLTTNYILLFKVYKEKNLILFVDIKHRDIAH